MVGFVGSLKFGAVWAGKMVLEVIIVEVLAGVILALGVVALAILPHVVASLAGVVRRVLTGDFGVVRGLERLARLLIAVVGFPFMFGMVVVLAVFGRRGPRWAFRKAWGLALGE